MKRYMIAGQGLVALIAVGFGAPANAQTTCNARFADRSVLLEIPDVELGAPRVYEQRELVRVEPVDREGQTDCRLSVRVSFADASEVFPKAYLSGNGMPVLPAIDAGVGTVDSDIPVAQIGSRGGGAVQFAISIPTDWGLPAGTRSQQFRLTLLDRFGSPLDEATMVARVRIPRSVDLKIVGSRTGGSIGQINLGVIEAGRETRSTPFGMRVWSSSGYTVTLESENRGTLMHEEGIDRIDYDLSVNGFEAQLEGRNPVVVSARHTDGVGDYYPMEIVVRPQRPLAGEYQDRVTVSVTAQ